MAVLSPRINGPSLDAARQAGRAAEGASISRTGKPLADVSGSRAEGIVSRPDRTGPVRGVAAKTIGTAACLPSTGPDARTSN